MRAQSKRKSPNRKTLASREKVQAHRERLRAQGLRPIQIWVPDTRSPKFAAEAARQSHLVASSRHAAEDQTFIEAISSGGDECGGARSGTLRAARSTPASHVR